MENIVIIGSSGHAKVIIDIVEKENKFTIAGLLDKFRSIGDETLGYKVLGGEEDLPQLLEKYNLIGGIVAIGDNWIRGKVSERILSLSPHFEFVRAIHPSANIAKNVQIGVGTVVMAGVAINSDSVIGCHCILNTNSSLDHDSVMDDFSSLAPHATTGGNVKIGKFSSISIGAKIIHGIDIDEHTVIGAGSVVLQNIPSFTVAYGLPACIIRNRIAGEKYL